MAKGRITLNCSNCGTPVEMSRTFNSRREADRWEEQMTDSTTLCKDCYRKEQNAKAEKATKDLELPAIEGVSEKQVTYAENLRRRLLAGANESIVNTKDLIERIPEEKILEVAKKYDGDRHVGLLKLAERYGLGHYYVALYYTNASDIIDYLR